MKAWLTQITLDPRSRHIDRELRDAVALHRRVMTLIPDQIGDNARRSAGVLFRVDEDHQPRLLVQTAVPPDPNRVPAQLGHTQTKDLTPLLNSVSYGMTVHYRLTANTSKRLAVNPGPGRHAPVIALRGTDAEQWWTTRARRCGLSLRTVRTHPLNDLHGRRGDHTIRHAATRFDGIAVIDDPDALREAILTGIGRAKSYGCGLLSIAPMRGTR